jgi:hypothetical protein
VNSTVPDRRTPGSGNPSIDKAEKISRRQADRQHDRRTPVSHKRGRVQPCSWLLVLMAFDSVTVAESGVTADESPTRIAQVYLKGVQFHNSLHAKLK